MTVKELKQKINGLKNDYDNMIKLQDYFMGEQANNEEIEEGADLTAPIRHLCTGVAETLSDEIKRLEAIIDNTTVSV